MVIASAAPLVVALVTLLLVSVIGGIYFLPTAIAYHRRVVNAGSVFAINLLLGWSLIGWAVALAMALRTNPAPPSVTVVTEYRPPTWPAPRTEDRRP